MFTVFGEVGVLLLLVCCWSMEVDPTKLKLCKVVRISTISENCDMANFTCSSCLDLLRLLVQVRYLYTQTQTNYPKPKLADLRRPSTRNVYDIATEEFECFIQTQEYKVSHYH